jgi:hypothetical protein
MAEHPSRSAFGEEGFEISALRLDVNPEEGRSLKIIYIGLLRWT